MTLILTRVARDGVVMAADSAITEQFGERVRILHGATKLLPHRASRSCIATWGGGTLPNPDTDKAPIATEFVVRSFLSQADGITSGLELVELFAEWLSNSYCATRDFIGFDVATVRPVPDCHLPAVYRVTNAESPDKAPQRFFRHRALREPSDYDPEVDQTIITAGDRNGRVWVESFQTALRHARDRTNLDPLPEDIDAVSRWLPALVRAVSDAYQSLEIGESIGGRVNCVKLATFGGDVTVVL